MSKQYKALKPIGRFEKGDFVGGLSEAEIKQHIQLGNIKEVEPEQVAPVAITKTKEVKVNG